MVTIDRGDVAFTTGNRAAVYVARGGGMPEIVADENTPVPGGSLNFAKGTFRGVDISEGTVAFHGVEAGFGRRGIYLDPLSDGPGPPFSVVADNDPNTAAPGGNAPFSNFVTSINPVIDDGDVLFLAEVSDGRFGLFLFQGDALELVADDTMSLPGGPELITRVETISLSEDEVAFVATDAGRDTRALFATRDVILERVIGQGDMLDGKLVDGIVGGPDMLSKEAIVFTAFFLDGSSAVYRADRGPIPVRDSGMIQNGAFTAALSSWTPSGSVQPTSAGAELTADDGIGPASLVQTIDTPNSSYMIFLDYRFTTTAGSLQLLINNTVVGTVLAPATLSPVFTREEILVNDTTLMNLLAADLVLRLNPGSLASILVRQVFSPAFAPVSKPIFTYARVKQGDDFNLDLEDWDVAPWGPGALAFATQSQGTPAQGGTASARALSVPFGGLEFGTQAIVQADAASDPGLDSLAQAQSEVRSLFRIGAVTPPLPVDVDFQLDLSGTIRVSGNFAAGTEAGKMGFQTVARIKSSRGFNDAFCGKFDVRSDLTPGGGIEIAAGNDIKASDIALIDEQITGDVVSRTYQIRVQFLFDDALYIEPSGSVEMKVAGGGGHPVCRDSDTVNVFAKAIPAFDGFVSADFLDTMTVTLSSETPDVEFVAVPEPSEWLLILSALIGIGIGKRRPSRR
jgi:hypothetical protein